VSDKALQAFGVRVNGTLCIVFAATRPKAKWVAVKAYREAGYGKRGEWPIISICRDPMYDDHHFSRSAPRAYTEEHVKATFGMS
jgi:hypothetical protein